MNTSPNPSAGGRLHPLMILAALAVLLFCLVGTAAILGWIPNSVGGSQERQLSEAERLALASTLPQPAPVVPGQQLVLGNVQPQNSTAPVTNYAAAPAPDGIPLLRYAGIEDLGVFMLAEGTFHGAGLTWRSRRGRLLVGIRPRRPGTCRSAA